MKRWTPPASAYPATTTRSGRPSSLALTTTLMAMMFGCATLTQAPIVQHVHVLDAHAKAGPDGSVYFASLEYRDLAGALVIETRQVTLREYLTIHGHTDACFVNGSLATCPD